MPHIRILRHYIHTPYLVMSLIEGLLILLSAFLGHFTRFGEFPELAEQLGPASSFALILIIAMSAMGVYAARVREGYIGMMLRTAVAIFLLGTAAVAVLSYVFPALGMARGVLLFSTFEAFLLLAFWRWATGKLLSEDALKRRVLILGSGPRARNIARRMRRRSDRRAFVLAGFVNHGGEDLVSDHGARVFSIEGSLLDYCNENKIDEIVVASDERRIDRDPQHGLPLEDLLDCRIAGVEICDVQNFIEREACKIDVDLLQPAWMVFSDGFVISTWREFNKRSFDLFTSLLLLSVIWPVMLVTALAIWISGRMKEPVLYKQERIGLNGEPFNVLKFRSMRTDAEIDGKARWAVQNDPRVTRIGAVIRKTRIDELPQLFNVLKGDMSFVGPRPERPTFVSELAEKIPYYDQRHRVKPGITGWAQLCYPYGASEDDAKEKLQYDLYYLKNQSILLDMIILLQTVEVVLVGDGAR